MSSNILEEIISSLNELNGMQQLNFELLEQLNVACEYFLKNYPHLPNTEKLAGLLSKALALFEEIRSKPPSDEFLQHKKSDNNFSELGTRKSII